MTNVFFNSGFVNSHNSRHWGIENPHDTIDKVNSKAKLMVWAAITSRGVIGPFFLEGRVNAEKYKAMIKDEYLPELRRKRFTLRDVVFQQDGATVHCTDDVLKFVKKKFGRVISRRNEDFVWPSYSPDLNACDFFLWGHLKTKVYADPAPKTLEELKNKIKAEVVELNKDKEIFARVYENFLTRLQYVLSSKGGYIEHILS